MNRSQPAAVIAAQQKLLEAASRQTVRKTKLVNPHTLVAQKVADEMFFDVSKVKKSSFFRSDLTDPPSDFCCASF